MFEFFRNGKQQQVADGPFGLTIGQAAIESPGPIIQVSIDRPEIFDNEKMHSFNKIFPEQHHQMFQSFYGRYVNAYGEGRSTGLSRVIACSGDFDEKETNCVAEFFNFLERLQSKYGNCNAVVDKRKNIVDCDEMPERKIPETLWRHLSSSQPQLAFFAEWDLTASSNPKHKKIDKINLSLYVKSGYGLQNIRYDSGYLALEYVFVNDRNADEIYAEELNYRGEKDDDVL